MNPAATTWNPIPQGNPCSDRNVLVALSDGDYCMAWWDHDARGFRACVDGDLLQGVTHWADVRLPEVSA